MSKMFYEHLLILEDLWEEIGALSISAKEKNQLIETTEELFHYKVMTLILDHLPKVHHGDFLQRFTNIPHDTSHLQYLEEKVGVSIHHEIAVLAVGLKEEVRSVLKKHKKHT